MSNAGYHSAPAEVVYQPSRVPINGSPATLAKSIVIPGHIVLYGFTFSNTNVATRFAQCFDLGALPANSTVPFLSKSCPTADAVGFSWAPQGRDCPFGLAICTSTANASLTLGAADAIFDVQYDVISDAGTVVSAEN